MTSHPSPDGPRPLTPEEEAFHEWLCRTARFSPTGMWGTVARNTIIALRADAARSASHDDDPPDLMARYDFVDALHSSSAPTGWNDAIDAALNVIGGGMVIDNLPAFHDDDPRPRPFRVTDPEADAPDGTRMMFERVGGSWEPLDSSASHDDDLASALLMQHNEHIIGCVVCGVRLPAVSTEPRHDDDLASALRHLPPATCYRTHTQPDEGKGVTGAVWIADVLRALPAVSTEPSDRHICANHDETLDEAYRKGLRDATEPSDRLREAATFALEMLDDLTAGLRRKDRDARLNPHALAEAIDAHTDDLRSALTPPTPEAES